MDFDVIVIGAGAAGMFAASVAGQRGRKVALIEHRPSPGEKIRISGGGRCNFTNLNTSPDNFLSDNPHFCKSALSRYTPADFLALMHRYGIGWHEKHKGQLFCNDSAEQIIALLRNECAAGKVQWFMPCKVAKVTHSNHTFVLATEAGELWSEKLVIATGGLSIPKIGASDFGYRLAKQFDHQIIPTRAGLVPLIFDLSHWQAFAGLAGLSLPVEVQTSSLNNAERGKTVSFYEDLLFTHRGLSGPAILQISSYWQNHCSLAINLLPAINLTKALIEKKKQSKSQLDTSLESYLPKRLVQLWLKQSALWEQASNRKIAEVNDQLLKNLGSSFHSWRLNPSGSEGYRKAEVTVGGIDTREVSQHSMESCKVAGLYFVGEVLDVTGWLGGYNFQWAWASGFACGSSV